MEVITTSACTAGNARDARAHLATSAVRLLRIAGKDGKDALVGVKKHIEDKGQIRPSCGKEHVAVDGIVLKNTPAAQMGF